MGGLKTVGIRMINIMQIIYVALEHRQFQESGLNNRTREDRGN